MYAVAVWPGCRGSKPNRASLPAAIATIIVSPIARDAARVMAAAMPDHADGTMTLRTASSGPAPRPAAASRRLCGTA